MNRKKFLSNLKATTKPWDMLIIGGGATGVGTAIDAASRGYRVLLLEQSDFGKGTSSRSTKLAHGGVRYLQQGNISLVLDALKERGIMRRNAPHLVHDLSFVVPNYDWWEGPFYGIGLKLYDILAGREGFGSSKLLSKEETLKLIPTLEEKGLRGGVKYYDGQFDDARLLINMVQTAAEQGATLLNYVRVTSLIKEDDLIVGVEAEDMETSERMTIRARVVVNATGVYTDSIRLLDNSEAPKIIASSQGVHITLDRSFLPGDTAIMVPQTDDGRVLFAIPWHGYTLIGTTDTPVKEYPLEPKAQEQEIEFLITHAARYLTKDPSRKDVKSIFVGLRPLVQSGQAENTAAISRDHTISISRSGLVSIAGGKWTTYRRMAEDVVDQALSIAQLEPIDCITKRLQIHGYHKHPSVFGNLSIYGSDAPYIMNLIAEDPEYAEGIHPNHTIVAGEVVWAIRHEMARTVDDFLARRTRILQLDAQAAIDMAPRVAHLMGKELGRNDVWVKNQIEEFKSIARLYLLEQ